MHEARRACDVLDEPSKKQPVKSYIREATLDLATTKRDAAAQVRDLLFSRRHMLKRSVFQAWRLGPGTLLPDLDRIFERAADLDMDLAVLFNLKEEAQAAAVEAATSDRIASLDRKAEEVAQAH